eukprot:5350908-Lingulodinium_polyedra.AAC.1
MLRLSAREFPHKFARDVASTVYEFQVQGDAGPGGGISSRPVKAVVLDVPTPYASRSQKGEQES